MSDSVCVCVMTYDEVGTLESVVSEIHDALVELTDDFEVLIIDDGSSDGCGPLADELAARRERVRVIHHERNEGLGGVYRTGFDNARCDLLTFFPADGQFPADILPHFVRTIRDADMVLGYLPGRRISLLGRALSLAERAVYAALFGPLPKIQGVFMFRRALLDEIELVSTGRAWTLVMELLIRTKRGGYRIISTPIRVRPRTHGASKVNNLRTVVENLRATIGLRRHL